MARTEEWEIEHNSARIDGQWLRFDIYSSQIHWCGCRMPLEEFYRLAGPAQDAERDPRNLITRIPDAILLDWAQKRPQVDYLSTF